MNTHKQIQQIAATDELLDQAIALTPIRKPKDLNHLQRRQQQRAISNDMIRVAIAYGQQRSDRHGAIVYTIDFIGNKEERRHKHISPLLL